MHSQSGRIESERVGVKHPAPSASANGGGVFVTSGTIDIISCEVYSNTARAAGDNADGGGIFVPGGASRSIRERDYKASESQQTRVNPFLLTIRSVPFQGPHGQTHTHKPRRGVRGRRSQTQRQHTLADAGVLSSTTLVGSLSLPAQLYRGWPAAAVAWPFPLRSPASPDASVALTTWCPPSTLSRSSQVVYM
jgi:hypothetical protein